MSLHISLKIPENRSVWGCNCILPDNVKANTVGTLKGEVESIYPLPATTDSASSILGSTSLANELVKDSEAPQQILIRLSDANYPSGYQWISGKGPSKPGQIPTVGGMASVNVIVEQKPPIVLALPALEEGGLKVRIDGII